MKIQLFRSHIILSEILKYLFLATLMILMGACNPMKSENQSVRERTEVNTFGVASSNYSSGLGCFIEVSDCEDSKIPIEENFRDWESSSHQSAENCAHRAKAFLMYCKTNKEVVSNYRYLTYTYNYFFRQYLSQMHEVKTIIDSQCRIQLPKSCTPGANITRTHGDAFLDFEDNSYLNESRCLQRAEDYHSWCGGEGQIQASFYKNGNEISKNIVGDEESLSQDLEIPKINIVKHPPNNINFELSASDNDKIQNIYCRFGNEAFRICKNKVNVPDKYKYGPQVFETYSVDRVGNKSQVLRRGFVYRHPIKTCKGSSGEPLLCSGNDIFYVKGHNLLPAWHVQDATRNTCLNENKFCALALSPNNYAWTFDANQVEIEGRWLKSNLNVNLVRLFLPSPTDPNFPGDYFRQDYENEGAISTKYLDQLRITVNRLGRAGLRTGILIALHFENEIFNSGADYSPGSDNERKLKNYVKSVINLLKDNPNVAWYEITGEALTKWDDKLKTVPGPNEDQNVGKVASIMFRMLKYMKQLKPDILRAGGEVIGLSPNDWFHPSPELYNFDDLDNLVQGSTFNLASEMEILGSHFYNVRFRFRDDNLNLRPQTNIDIDWDYSIYSQAFGIRPLMLKLREKAPNKIIVSTEWGFISDWYNFDDPTFNQLATEYQLKFFKEFFNTAEEISMAGSVVWAGVPNFKADKVTNNGFSPWGDISLKLTYNGLDRTSTGLPSLYLFDIKNGFTPDNFTRRPAGEFYKNYKSPFKR